MNFVVKKMIRTLFALLLITILSSPSFAEDKKYASTYDRVMKTGVIRCGYLSLPPFIIKDPNSGEISGIVHDTMEAAGRLLGVKIDWNEEVGFATMDAGLEAGRYDTLCFGYYKNPTNAKYGNIGFSDPLFYVPMSVFARKDDNRFANNIEAINDPSVRISTVDGSLTNSIAQEDFPKAKVISLPNLTDFSQTLQEVASGKADAVIVNLVDGLRFQKNNPEKIVNVTKGQPIRVYAATIAYPQQDARFAVMLDAALEQLQDSGYIRGLVKKYQVEQGTVFLVAKPYVAN